MDASLLCKWNSNVVEIDGSVAGPGTSDSASVFLLT